MRRRERDSSQVEVSQSRLESAVPLDLCSTEEEEEEYKRKDIESEKNLLREREQ